MSSLLMLLAVHFICCVIVPSAACFNGYSRSSSSRSGHGSGAGASAGAGAGAGDAVGGAAASVSAGYEQNAASARAGSSHWLMVVRYVT